MTRLPIPFGNPDTYPGHSGVDYGQSSGTIFRASGVGHVVSHSYNPRCGYGIWVYYDAIDATVGHCHMNSHDGCPPEGASVVEGSQLGYVGYSGHVIPEGPQGAHLHQEVEGYTTTAGYWLFFDPDRLVGHSGGGKDPVPPAPEPLEEEMSGITPVNLKWQGEHKLALGQAGSLRHYLPTDPFQRERDIFSAEDAWVDMTFDELRSALVTVSADPNIFDFRGGKFGVVDPLKIVWDETTGRPVPGKDGWGSGNSWSRSKVIQADGLRMMRKLGVKLA